MASAHPTHTLILVRHGESAWNSSNKFAGWVDIPLSERGESQAIDAGKMILESGLKPDSLHTSKLTRSCITGNLILSTLHREFVDISRTWRLNERHYGSLQGQDKKDILQKVGKDKYMFWRRAYDGCPPEIDPSDEFACINDDRYNFTDIDHDSLPRAESLHMTLDRLMPYFDSNIKPELLQGKTVLVVAHGSTIRGLVKLLNKVSDDDIAHLNIPNAIPLVFELNDKMEPIKDYHYLDPEAALTGAENVKNQGFH